MVLGSRSLRGRRSNSYTEANAAEQNLDEAPKNIERVKRHRVASVSERNAAEKRRRTEITEYFIPVRNKSTQESSLRDDGAQTRPGSSSLVCHDSTVSTSSSTSSSLRPQYDQFRRIEEHARKIGRSGADAETKDDKRKLRSEHGSTRSKTELAQYFPTFEEMMSMQPVDSELLTAKTRVVVVNDAPNLELRPRIHDYFGSQRPPYNAEVLDLSNDLTFLTTTTDPLNERVYLKAHQKAERHEKQIKNGDKERAQHEKLQLERLLDELRGPDWLKTLGVSGVTDTEKKRYEVKRSLFVREVKVLLDKFRRWKEGEKRRKQERQQALLERRQVDTSDEESRSSTTLPRRRNYVLVAAQSASRTGRSLAFPIGPDPITQDSEYVEVDTLASQQLISEAKLASVQHRQALAADLATRTSGIPEPTSQPFTSFFQKGHIRDAAMDVHRRGRRSYAFGVEVAAPAWEVDFELPDELLTEDAIRASQRRSRRIRRGAEE